MRMCTEGAKCVALGKSSALDMLCLFGAKKNCDVVSRKKRSLYERFDPGNFSVVCDIEEKH